MSAAYAHFLLLGCCSILAHAQDSLPTFGTTVVVPGGLCGEIYEIPVNTSRLPRFENLEPAGIIYTSSLNVSPRDFAAGFPGVTNRFEWFAIDYHGKFWIAKPGKYKFALMSDDGSNLYIDDVLVIDNDGQHPPERRAASALLSGGIHRMRVSYFQGPRFQVALVLAVAGPGQKWQIFSTEEFKPPTNPDDWAFPTQLPSEPVSDRTKLRDVVASPEPTLQRSSRACREQ